MAAQRLTKRDVGCWVLKANPETWAYFDAIEADGVRPGEVVWGSWTLSSNYRTNDLMQKHDPMVLFVTGARRSGIHEVGFLAGEPVPCEGMNTDFAVDLEVAAQPTMAVDYWGVRLREPVPRGELKSHKTLSKAEHFRMPQMSNPTYLTPIQWRSLWRLLEGRLPPGMAKVFEHWEELRQG
jgi:hypothetical protein